MKASPPRLIALGGEFSHSILSKVQVDALKYAYFQLESSDDRIGRKSLH